MDVVKMFAAARKEKHPMSVVRVKGLVGKYRRGHAQVADGSFSLRKSNS
jgi:hypothetical protein